MKDKNFITINEAARVSSYSTAYLTRLAKTGKFEAKKVDNQWRVNSVALQKFIASTKEEKKYQQELLQKQRLLEIQLKDNSVTKEDVENINLFSTDKSKAVSLRTLLESAFITSCLLFLFFFGSFIQEEKISIKQLATGSTDILMEFSDRFFTQGQSLVAAVATNENMVITRNGSIFSEIWCNAKLWFGLVESCVPSAFEFAVVTSVESTEDKKVNEPLNNDSLSNNEVRPIYQTTNLYPTEKETIREVIIREGNVDTSRFVTFEAYNNQVDAIMRSIENSSDNSSSGGSGGGSGTVTSVNLSVPTALTVTGGPITDSGTLALSLTSGYTIPLTASTTNWDTAFSWGDHSGEGYLTNNNPAILTNATTTNLVVTNSITTALADGCVEVASGILTSTGSNCGVGGGGITSLNGLTNSSQTFATSSSNGLTFNISSSGSVHTFTSGLSAGYTIPLTASTTEWTNTHNLVTASSTLWDTAYSWGDHSLVGYLTNIATTTVRGMFGASTGLSYNSTTGEFTNTGVTSLGGLTGAVATSSLHVATSSYATLSGTSSIALSLNGFDQNDYLTLSAWNATTTDALDEGSNNLYFTNSRADARIAAGTSTIQGMFSAGAGLSYTGGQFTNTGVLSIGGLTGAVATSSLHVATSTYALNLSGFDQTDYLTKANNLSDLASTTIARTNLGLGSLAVLNDLSTFTTTDLTEGTNLYWTDNRFDTRLAATSSLPTLTTLANLTTVGTITSGTWNGTAIGDAYLTKTGDWTGTFDGQEGSFYLNRANHTGTQTASTISDFSTTARGLLSSTATGLTYATSTGVFSLTSGYNIPLTASTTNWNTFYTTPSNRITAGTDLAWGGNTLNFTNGTGYITGNETITFSGDAVGTGTTSIALSLATNSVADNEIDYTAVTLADFTNDANFLTNITGESFLDLADTPASYTANRIPYMTGSAITTNANFVFDGTNLGVGTTSPAAELHVEKSGGGTIARFKEIGYGGINIDSADAVAGIQGISDSLAAGTLAINRYGGNVGIGTSSPSAKLQVTDGAIYAIDSAAWLMTSPYDAYGLLGGNKIYAQSPEGGFAIVGASRLSDTTATTSAPAGIAGWAFNDGHSGSEYAYGVWGAYFEGRKLSGAINSVYTQGVEIDITDISGGTINHITPQSPHTAGSTMALWVGSGGDKPGSAQTASVAMGIVNNGSDFAKGILFGEDAIATVGGYTTAIALATGQEINWYRSGSPSSTIRDDSTTLSQKLLFANEGTLIQNATGTTLFQFYPGASAVNGIGLISANTGEAAQITSIGETNVDLSLMPKGSGNVGIGTITPSSKLTVNGTVEFESLGGGFLKTNASGILSTSTIGVADLTASDFGDFTCNGTTCSLDTNSVADNEIDYTAVTLADFTNDANFLTNITGESFLDLADTPASYTANRIPYMTGSAITTNANFVFDGTNLGVGTTSPAVGFHVQSGGNFTGTTNSDNLGIFAKTTASNSQAVLSVVSGSDGVSYLTLGGDGATSFDNGRISYNAATNFLGLWTKDGQHLTIDTTGKVGIGSTIPSNKLQVVDTSSGAVTNVALFGNDAAGTLGSGARIYLSGANSVTRGSYIEGVNSNGAGNAHDLIFGTSGSAADPTERMRITNAGNVGIGTTTPSTKLDVVGLTRLGTPTANNPDVLTLTSLNDNLIVFDRTGDGTKDWQVGLDNTDSSFLIQQGTNSFGTAADVALSVESNGNVGIGTTTPDYKLSINSTTNALRIDGGILPATAGMVNINSNSATNKPTLSIETGGNASGEQGLLVYARGGVFLGDVVTIDALDTGGYNLLNVTDGNGANSRFVVQAGGNVGIGNAAPAQKLSVLGNVHAYSGSHSVIVDGEQGSIEIQRNDGAPFIDFKSDGAEDYDTRIQQSSNGLTFATGGNGAASVKMLIDSEGDVAIGDATANWNFKVNYTNGTNKGVLFTNANENMIFTGANNVNKIYGGSWADDMSIFTTGTGGVSREGQLYLKNDGNVGIGTTSPADLLHVAGDVRVGTGTTGCVKDADGTVIAGTCSSDVRLKDNITSADSILDAFTDLRFVTYNWNQNAFNTYQYGKEATQYGLIADEVETVFSELIHTDALGYKTLDYSTLQLYGLKAIQELNLKLEELTTTSTNYPDLDTESFTKRFFNALIAWFADATNGIGSMYASVFKASEMVCIGETCIDETQLKELLGEKASGGENNNEEDDNNNGGGSSGGGNIDDNTNNDDNNATSTDDVVVDDVEDDAGEVATSTDDGTGGGEAATPEEDESEEEIIDEVVEEETPEEEVEEEGIEEIPEEAVEEGTEEDVVTSNENGA